MLSGVLAQDLPVVQLVRGGGLVARVGLWLASEAKGLTDGWTRRPSRQTWQCQPPETSTRHGPASVQDIMDATHYLFWTLHLHQVGGLQEAELEVST